mgnify:CR=1 FL=1
MQQSVIPGSGHQTHIDRRIAQMEAEGTRFRAGVNIGVDITWEDLRSRYDAVLVATGATKPRDLNIPGRELDGVHFAMDYLVPANRVVAGEAGRLAATADHGAVQARASQHLHRGRAAAQPREPHGRPGLHAALHPGA